MNTYHEHIKRLIYRTKTPGHHSKNSYSISRQTSCRILTNIYIIVYLPHFVHEPVTFWQNISKFKTSMLLLHLNHNTSMLIIITFPGVISTGC